MTQENAVSLWIRSADDALEAAELLLNAGKFNLALFHCHLAVEKKLKAKYMELHDAAAPYTHNLLKLASEVGQWTEEDKKNLGAMSEFCSRGRYEDEEWEINTSEEMAEKWINIATKIFHSISSL